MIVTMSFTVTKYITIPYKEYIGLKSDSGDQDKTIQQSTFNEFNRLHVEDTEKDKVGYIVSCIYAFPKKPCLRYKLVLGHFYTEPWLRCIKIYTYKDMYASLSI